MLEIDPAKGNSTVAGGESVIKLYNTQCIIWKLLHSEN